MVAGHGVTLCARHVDRLRWARKFLDQRGYDVWNTVLTCCSGTGFAPAPAADDGRILTIGLDDLYAAVSES